jgi:hypothetical protein
MQFIMTGWMILPGQLQQKYNLSYVFMMILILGLSCKHKNQTNQIDTANKEIINAEFLKLPEDFQQFYKAFHQDSVFQMNHIDFPLQGIPDQADPDENYESSYFYTADQWILHKEFNPLKFEIFYLRFGDIIIEERIIEKQHQLMVVRRFAKNAKDWRLIYYAGVNKYKAKD